MMHRQPNQTEKRTMDSYSQILFFQKSMQNTHYVRNSIWLKKNRACDNEAKFHSFLMCRFWIYNRKWFHNWTSELWCIWHIFGKLVYFCLFFANPVNITVDSDSTKKRAANRARKHVLWHESFKIVDILAMDTNVLSRPSLLSDYFEVNLCKRSLGSNYWSQSQMSKLKK